MSLRRRTVILIASFLLAACKSAGSPETGPVVTATVPPFARPLDGASDPSSPSVIERASVPLTTPGAAPGAGEAATPQPGTPSTAAAPASESTPDGSSGSSAASQNPAPASGGTFDLIPVDGGPPDRPDYLHADLNLALRGFTITSAEAGLVDYDGETDANAPQLWGLFGDDRMPTITSTYQVYSWIWDPAQCGGTLHGCRGEPDDGWPVTMVGFATAPGEPIYPPQRGPEVHPGGYVAMVLYAEASRITLEYTRADTVAFGYTVHIENVCVDPGLLALYRAQTDAGGWHVTGYLPALRNDEALGYACGGEIQVAIRDSGSFMDPRSRKDWW